MCFNNPFILFSTNSLKKLKIENKEEREYPNDVHLILFPVHPDDDDRIHQRMELVSNPHH